MSLCAMEFRVLKGSSAVTFVQMLSPLKMYPNSNYNPNTNLVINRANVRPAMYCYKTWFSTHSRSRWDRTFNKHSDEF